MIRPATTEDARAMGLLRRRACRLAYDGLVDPRQLDQAEDLDIWEQRVAAAPEDSLWVYDADGKVAGFVSALPEAQDQPGVGFLQGLYVDPAAQGAGVGTALHHHAIDVMRDSGASEATLWVLADYERGRQFFEKHGWKQEPGIEDNDSSWHAAHYRYRRSLATSGA